MAALQLPYRELIRHAPGPITARLDRMEGERELAPLAAVLGREFSYELLTAVAKLA